MTGVPLPAPIETSTDAEGNVSGKYAIPDEAARAIGLSESVDTRPFAFPFEFDVESEDATLEGATIICGDARVMAFADPEGVEARRRQRPNRETRRRCKKNGHLWKTDSYSNTFCAICLEPEPT